MLTRIWFYIILALAASTASLGWLSVHNYRAKVEAESALVAAINVNTDMQKSLNLKDLSCKIDDTLSAERQEEKALSDVAKEKDLSSIDKLPSRNPTIPQRATSDESNIVDIDAELPESLRLLLSESYNRAKGRTGDATRQPSD